MAVANYHDTYGCFPPAWIADANGRPMHSWRVLILPHLDQAPLYKQYNFNEPWDSPANRKLLSRCPPQFKLHGRNDDDSTTNYLAVVGPETAFPGGTSRTYKDITDGPANTILVVENVGKGVLWMEPVDLDFATMDFNGTGTSPNGLSSLHQPVAVLMGDGSARRIPDEVPPDTLRALLTAVGGEAIGPLYPTITDGRLRPRRADVRP